MRRFLTLALAVFLLALPVCAQQRTHAPSALSLVDTRLTAHGQKPPYEARVNWTHPLARGLVGLWLFNENGGATAYDATGYGNHGTMTDMEPATDWVAGRDGPVLDFDGGNDYVEVPTISIPTAITVSAWVYSSDFDQYGMVATKNPVNTQWAVFFSTDVSGKLNWRGGAAGGTTSCDAPTNNAWHHIVGMQRGTETWLYIDGIECVNSTHTAIGNGADLINFGRFDNGSPGYYFTGRLHNVAIYSRALVASEIAWLYVDPYAPFSQTYAVAARAPAAVAITAVQIGDLGAAVNSITQARFGTLTTPFSSVQRDSVWVPGATAAPVYVYDYRRRRVNATGP